MKQADSLKWARVILAAIFFIPILLYFIDFAGLIPDQVHALLHIQLIPAILSGMVGLVIFQLMLAFLLGRIYCSVICPAGVLQDIMNRIFCIGKKKKNGIYRFRYTRPLNLFRYVLLGITILLAILGITELVVWLDPYSNFGRIAANLFRPVYVWGNNILADLLAKADNYTLYHVTLKTVTTAGLIFALVAFLTFGSMVVLRGRLFCNTLCPVGAFLSLISRYSLFTISFDKKACNHCGICERTCKAEAIDSKNMQVDTSRCVDCFNCLSGCKKNSLHYGKNPLYKKEKRAEVAHSTSDAMIYDRRSFLATGVTVAATLPVVSAMAQGVKEGVTSLGKEKPQPLTPPGSLNLERFKDKCTGCHLCVAKCPSQILRPAGIQFGLSYMLRPHVSYNDSYCNYECTICSEVCPTQAIKPLTIEEKVTTQIGIATFYIDRCIVKTEGTDCGACSEHCPTQAVHMVPYTGTLTIPKVIPDLCVGCGGCESICPVRPDRAIIVQANEVHQFVNKPEEEESLEINADDIDFGF